MKFLGMDIRFGDKEHLDWRTLDTEEDDDDNYSEDPTPEQKRAMREIAGIDTDELWPDDDEEDYEAE